MGTADSPTTAEKTSNKEDWVLKLLYETGKMTSKTECAALAKKIVKAVPSIDAAYLCKLAARGEIKSSLERWCERELDVSFKLGWQRCRPRLRLYDQQGSRINCSWHWLSRWP